MIPAPLHGFSRAASFLRGLAVLSIGLMFSSTGFLRAGDAVGSWSSFRDGGTSRASAPLPTRWSASEGIAWQKELEGYGQSAPVIHADKVIVTSVIGPNCQQIAVDCLDLATGQATWSYRRASSNEHPSNYMNARAAPTPIVDDAGVYAFFETGDFVALDWEGEMIWHRDETEASGKFDNSHGIGASPASDATSLYLLIEHGGPSSLSAINKTDGSVRWAIERDSTKSWASPVIATIDGRSQVIVSSGGTVTGYDTADGSEVWQLDGVEGNSVPSPVVDGERLIVAARLPEFSSDGQVRANCAVDLSRLKDGNPEVLWRAEKAISEYASPVVCGEFVYFLNKANVLHCIDIATGEIVYRKRLSLACWATPIVAGDLVYFFAKSGETKVVRAGPTYEEVAVNALWDVSNPPAPLHYRESQGGHGGHGGGGASGAHAKEGVPTKESLVGGHGGEGPKQAPGGGMVARMMAGDANGDGVLEGEEVPEMFRAMIGRIDTDGDGRIDADELEAMAKSFAERRKDAAASARDPIVYGVAAADGRIAIRTGTRLYVVAHDH